jgi:hypothetical protein
VDRILAVIEPAPDIEPANVTLVLFEGKDVSVSATACPLAFVNETVPVPAPLMPPTLIDVDVFAFNSPFTVRRPVPKGDGPSPRRLAP